MGRQRLDLDRCFLIVGYDRPMRSLYAQLYEHGDDPGDAPRKAVGYHPMERIASERTEHWDYPADRAALTRALTDWGLTAGERESVRRAIDSDLDLAK